MVYCNHHTEIVQCNHRTDIVRCNDHTEYAEFSAAPVFARTSWVGRCCRPPASVGSARQTRPQSRSAAGKAGRRAVIKLPGLQEEHWQALLAVEGAPIVLVVEHYLPPGTS